MQKVEQSTHGVIVVATQNGAKLDVVRGIFAGMGIDETRVMGLGDLGIETVYAEEGSLMERATSKVSKYREAIVEAVGDALAGIVGVDEGIHIEDGELVHDIQTVVKDLSLGKLGELGTRVTLNRVFSFLLFPDEIVLQAETEIPFTLAKILNEGDFSVEGYPLSRVLAYSREKRVVAEMEPERYDEFNLFYSREALMKPVALLDGGNRIGGVEGVRRKSV